jgi:hypothetical protein
LWIFLHPLVELAQPSIRAGAKEISMKRSVIGIALCMSAAVVALDATAGNAAAQGAAIAKSKGWFMAGSLTPAAFQGAGNKPIMLVFRCDP